MIAFPGILSLFLLGTSLLVAGCVEEHAASSPPVRIGLITYKEAALTQQIGIPTTNAAYLALDEANANGGLLLGSERTPVELVIKSINNNPQEAVAATRKLTNLDNVLAIVGPSNSSDAIPAGAFAEKARVPLISPMSTNRKTTEGREFVFRMSFVDDFQGAVIARFSRLDLRAESAAVLFNESDPYSQGVAEVFIKTFRDMGGEIVAIERFLPNEKDYSAQLQRIRHSRAKVLLLPNFAEVAKAQGLQARRLGIDATLLGCDGWDERQLAVLPEFDGAFMSTHWAADHSSEQSQNFAQKYRARFHQEPVAAAALTYDAFKLLFLALEKSAATDGSGLQTAMTNLGPVDGVTGTVDYSAGGDPVKSVVILKFTDRQGRFHKQVTRQP